jgi:outer membrane lipoprotein carrier protein
MRSSFGRVASSASTIGCFIAGAAMVAGAWIVCLPSARAADAEIERMLKGVEERYNHTETLQVAFAETYTAHGRKHTEQGELYLRKPGRTRWEYRIPAGKLFGSDGKFAYSYFPDEKRFDKMSLKETDDMKAPLAFLLGKLQFAKEFREFRTQQDGPSTFITAIPKSDKMPYTEVTFLVDPNFTIRWLNVKGQDGSQLDFAFSAEKRNPPIAESMFKFAPPLGVIYTDSSQKP